MDLPGDYPCGVTVEAARRLVERRGLGSIIAAARVAARSSFEHRVANYADVVFSSGGSVTEKQLRIVVAIATYDRVFRRHTDEIGRERRTRAVRSATLHSASSRRKGLLLDTPEQRP